MRALVLFVLIGCGKSDPPPKPAPPPVPASPLPRATAASAVVLADATPVAVVTIGAHGELGVADWTGALPVRPAPAADADAVEAAVLARAKLGDDHDTMAVAKWSSEAGLRRWRDRVGETEQEVEFTIHRSYFGHFPAGLDPKRPEDESIPWEQIARLRIARSEAVDRVPPLAPLIASAPDAPALATVRIAQQLGGALGVMVGGKLGVLRRGFRWGFDMAPEYRGEEPWVEVRAAAAGLEVIDFAANKVTPVAWDKIAALALPAGTKLADVLVAPDLTAQRLVDVLAALRGVHWVNLAEAPRGTGAERLAKVLAARHQDRMDKRVKISDFYLDDHLDPAARAVEAALATELPAMGTCYDERRAQMASPASGLNVSFVLSPAGAISKLVVENDDKPLEACFREVIQRVKFPARKARRVLSGSISLKPPE